MAVTANQVTFDTPAPEFQLPATDGKTYALDDLRGPEGHRRRLHLQPLPLRQGGDRSHGCGRAGVGADTGTGKHEPWRNASCSQMNFFRMVRLIVRANRHKTNAHRHQGETGSHPTASATTQSVISHISRD